MKQFLKTAYDISRIVTRRYSTSFYTASLFYPKEIRQAIFNIYGFVRLADEIVDTFHGFPQRELIDNFQVELDRALDYKISTNPILHSFQETVYRYGIPYEYIQAFMKSMKMDLEKKDYTTKEELDEYIYGSASVVGLMCLYVFCKGDKACVEPLIAPAKSLGEAFQKVNFLRDLNQDMQSLQRSYFPQLAGEEFKEHLKFEIVKDIEADFASAFQGIKRLPNNSKPAVAIAYYYYLALLQKIKYTPVHKLLSKRYRISNFRKSMIVSKAVLMCKINLI